MKYIYTDIYEKFSCVGGSCPNSCCIGWDVLIDSDTYNKYAALEEPLRSAICEQMEETEAKGEKIYKMRMKENGRCPFLNEQNLCNIYIDVSPDAMCTICKRYPRKNIVYGDTIMSTVMLSCPEVVRMLLEKNEPIDFGFVENGVAATNEDVDWELYNELINGLVMTTDILQDRQMAFWKRIYLVLMLTHTIQEHIEEGKLSSLRGNTACYMDKKYRQQQTEALQIEKLFGGWNVIHSVLTEIERLTEANLRLSCYKEINEADDVKYQSWLEAYRKIESETEYENMAVEFIFEYYMEAMNGKSLFGGVVKMLLLLLLIRTMEMLEYHEQGKLLKDKKIVLISKVCRVMEHTPVLEIMAERIIGNNEREQLFQLAHLLR